jgi:mitochondrial intermediate peptidase
MGVRLRLQAQFTRRELLVYPGSLQAQMIMRSAPSEEARRKVYVASNSSSPEQVEVLERLLQARAELARLVGKESYSHMTLTDKMAKCPGERRVVCVCYRSDVNLSRAENVAHFLTALMDYTKPYARRALRTLGIRKQSHLGTGPGPIIQAWDRDYYCPPEAPAPPIPLPPLTLGTVFMGLSRLFKHLYGITLRPAEVASGEVWHTDIRKLEVVDEDSGVIGWIYADIFDRRGKAAGAAHYTVRCSRRVDDDDLAGDYRVSSRHVEDDRDRGALSEAFDAAHRRQIRGHEGVYQLPVVVLLCAFPRPSVNRGPTVLDWHEVLTLFHEMGHAMHCECRVYRIIMRPNLIHVCVLQR